MLYIFDDFSKSPNLQGKTHGYWVETAAREVLGGEVKVARFDLNDVTTNHQFIVDTLSDVLGDKDITTLNLSFGGGFSRSLGLGNYGYSFDENRQPFSGFYELAKDLFLENKSFIVPTGNELFGSHKGTMDFYVSNLATTGFTLNVAAGQYLGGGQGEFALYSQFHPGFVDYVVKGEIGEDDGVMGTSFAAPRLAGTVEALSAKWGDLSQAEIRTILEETCDYGLYERKGNPLLYGDDSHGSMSYKFLNTDRALSYEFERGEVTTRMKVSALYEIYLDRNPEQEGFEFWMEKFNEGRKDEIISAFKNSAEFSENSVTSIKFDKVPVMQQIQAMYHLFLDREADDEGLAYWTNLVVEKTGEAMNKNFGDYAFGSGAQDEFQVALIGFLDAARGNGETVNTDYYFV